MNVKRVQVWGIISLFAVLGIELLSDKMFVINEKICTWPMEPRVWIQWILLAVCIVCLMFSVAINRKYIFVKGSSKAGSELTPSKRKGFAQKIKDVLKTLIKNSVSGNSLDLLFVVFFILHLTWIPDAIFDSLKNDSQMGLASCLFHPIIYIAGLLLVIVIKPQVKKRESQNPRVVLSGISFITQQSTGPLMKPFENETIEEFKVFVDRRIKVISLEKLDQMECAVELEALYFLSKVEKIIAELREKLPQFEEMKNEMVGIRSSLAVLEKELVASENIVSLERAIKSLYTILLDIVLKLKEGQDEFYSLFDKRKEKAQETFYLFFSELLGYGNPLHVLRVKLEREKRHNVDFFPYETTDTLRSWIVKRFVKELVKGAGSDAKVEVIECDYDDIQQTYRVIADVTKELLEREYRDSNLLFNITPGTANFSVALALNSIKGDRVCAYTEQNGVIEKGVTEKRFRKEVLDVYDLREVFSELLD